MNRFLHKLTYAAIAILGLTSVSCSMMEDDVQECPTGLYVRYVYDYNTMRSDMFKDHVGHVTLYIYDEDGRKVAERSESNSDTNRPLANYGYTMHFSLEELPPGKYRLQAVGMQSDWAKAQNTARAKYKRTEGHSEAKDFTITLEHSEQPQPETGRHSVDHNKLPLDTLWHTLKVMSEAPVNSKTVPPMPATKAPFTVYPLEEQYVIVEKDRATYATVSMIRDTKHLNVALRQIADPMNIQHSTYEVLIDDDNSILAHDNSIVPNHPLRYSSYAEWTTLFNENGLVVESGDLVDRNPGLTGLASRLDDEYSKVYRRTAHYNIMFNRLMFYQDKDKCARLIIRNKDTGKEVANINLPSILAEGRTADEYYYPHQEYLDREHDYHLDFLLKGETWEYMTVEINALKWAYRVQNENL